MSMQDCEVLAMVAVSGSPLCATRGCAFISEGMKNGKKWSLLVSVAVAKKQMARAANELGMSLASFVTHSESSFFIFALAAAIGEIEVTEWEGRERDAFLCAAQGLGGHQSLGQKCHPAPYCLRKTL